MELMQQSLRTTSRMKRKADYQLHRFARTRLAKRMHSCESGCGEGVHHQNQQLVQMVVQLRGQQVRSWQLKDVRRIRQVRLVSRATSITRSRQEWNFVPLHLSQRHSHKMPHMPHQSRLSPLRLKRKSFFRMWTATPRRSPPRLFPWELARSLAKKAIASVPPTKHRDQRQSHQATTRERLTRKKRAQSAKCNVRCQKNVPVLREAHKKVGQIWRMKKRRRLTLR
mmetsp:Transcript_106215/g.165819  ORF Transcript_106215/g.165819 Transcript_106215/m.165819 type:complete len:225 (+) Transcript_106215:244-918(+)